ncbi:hypothetical protein [Nocardia sputi]|uniref:hypothetical protein n=1 Tax=Nocardia sputi TaxID=2943705 RepID=UPI0020C05DFB|nr:hypothetical protein [Nocardia sputi]
MSGDPVEESSQAIRTGFIQSMQTAAMMTNLLQRRGGEARSRTEFEQRVRQAEAKEYRSSIEHQVRVNTGVEKAADEHALNQARLTEVQDRNSRAEDLFDLEAKFKSEQIERARTNQRNREESERVAGDQNRELHQARMGGYTRRETHDNTLHDLDVEYKQLLIDIRRRTAGFTDTLTDIDGSGPGESSSGRAADPTGEAGDTDTASGGRRMGTAEASETSDVGAGGGPGATSAGVGGGGAARAAQDQDGWYLRVLAEVYRRTAWLTGLLIDVVDVGAAAASSAAYAAATGAAGLSDQHAAHADAYQQRFIADTGAEPRSLHEGAKAGEPIVIDIDPADVVVTDTEITGPGVGSAGVGTDAVFALTKELTTGAYLEHAAGLGPEPVTPGSVPVADVLDAAGLTDVSAGELRFDLGPEPPPSAGPAPGPDVGPGR